ADPAWGGPARDRPHPRRLRRSLQAAPAPEDSSLIERAIAHESLKRGRRFQSSLSVTVEAPGVALLRDAAPSDPLFSRAHLGPALDFVEEATTSLADLVALAGGADGDAGGIGLALEPGHPGRLGLG